MLCTNQIPHGHAPLSVRRTGRSRQMAFIGFRSPEQAEDAIRFFNKSFMGASKLSVEKALPVRSHSPRM